MQDTPVSIAAFDSEAITEKRLSTMEDLQVHTPGLVFGETGGITHITLRGVGQSITVGNGETGVGLYVDGVYMGHNVISSTAFKDLERIEVLRGPRARCTDGTPPGARSTS